MATMGTKPILLLGLEVTALVTAAAQAEDKKNVKVIAATQPVVTIYNPAGLVVDILNDDKNVRVATEVVTLNLTQAEEDLQFSVADGSVVEVITVQDGDVLVLIADPADPLHVQAFKVLEGGDASLTPLHPFPAPTKASKVSNQPPILLP